MFRTSLITLALVGFAVAAPAQNSSALDVAAIEAHFTQAGLVGDKNLLAAFSPSALLTVNFDGVGAIQPGQALSQDQSKPQPTISVQPANSTVTLEGNYTVFMVDADIVGTDESSPNQTRHWLINSATLSGDVVSAPKDTTAVVTPYAGPGPAPGSGVHRYVILLYSQPASFAAPANLEGGVQKIKLQDYVSQTGLNLVAGTYFTVENGQASVSVSATSPVQSGTLSAPSASGSASGSGSPSGANSGSAKPSGTGSGSNPAPSSAGAKIAAPVTAFGAVLALAAAML